MSERFRQLTARHAELRRRSDMQRHELGDTVDDIQHQLSGVDRAIDAVRRAVRSPVVIVAAGALVALLGPRRLFKFVSRGALAYTTARRLIRR